MVCIDFRAFPMGVPFASSRSLRPLAGKDVGDGGGGCLCFVFFCFFVPFLVDGTSVMNSYPLGHLWDVVKYSIPPFSGVLLQGRLTASSLGVPFYLGDRGTSTSEASTRL